MKFFNVDLHISVIEDVKTIFRDLGHEVKSVNMSGHNWVFGREQQMTEIITPQNWRHINPVMCDEFYCTYRKRLEEYDGFIVTYPPAFSLLFQRFDKPIIAVAATRYEMPCDDFRLPWLQEQLRHPNVHLVANNKFDQQYMETRLGRKPLHIPSLCNYTGQYYRPRYSQYVLASRVSVNSEKLVKLPVGHTWAEQVEYSGVVHIPYNVSVMSLFEHYSQNMPLFFPTPQFLEQLHAAVPQAIMSEVSYEIGRPMNEQEKEWLPLADFYDSDWMPHIQYFNDIRDLDRSPAQLTYISEEMRAFNRVRKERVYTLWENLLDNIKNCGKIVVERK